jgi:UDPglucose--hexose-1-phosphate uridylyltransferase
MLINELRKDYLLNRFVVIAKERKKRPTDFVKREKEREPLVSCPFCPNNEHATPPAVLVYLSSNGEIRKERDENGFRHKKWRVRVVPNLYPAVSPPDKDEVNIQDTASLKNAFGHHEVIIESPHHSEHPSVARVSQLTHVVNAYLDRLNVLSRKPYVKYVSIFRNHGKEAGASLSHAHTQLITTPIIPRILEEELRACKRFWIKERECLFCNILKREKKSARFIWDNTSFVVFAPWASIHPFEFWIFPKKHNPSLLDISQNEVNKLAETLRACFGGLKTLLNDPPYNFGFHIAPTERAPTYYHWHIEVYPRLTTWAGLEKSTGTFINVIPPEDAAADLKEKVLAEEGEESKG